MIKLFSVRVDGASFDLNQVRIYNKDIDPGSFDEGMHHGDFSNGFTMGGYHQLFQGITDVNELDFQYSSLNKLKQED